MFKILAFLIASTLISCVYMYPADGAARLSGNLQEYKDQDCRLDILLLPDKLISSNTIDKDEYHNFEFVVPLAPRSATYKFNIVCDNEPVSERVVVYPDEFEDGSGFNFGVVRGVAI